jgi:hypothetical protein
MSRKKFRPSPTHALSSNTSSQSSIAIAKIDMAFADEEQPLLRQITTNDSKIDDVILDFEPQDPEDPRNWSEAFKWFIVLLLACMSFTV